jgi:hypothetical protein
VSGNVSLKCTVKLDPGAGDGTWAKAGAMVRDEIDPASAFGFAMIRAQGRDFGPQWRDSYGTSAGSNDAILVGGVKGTGIQSGTIEITREGTNISYYYYNAKTGKRVRSSTHKVVDMEDPVYVGLVVTSHRTGYTSSAVFTDVVLRLGDISDVGDWSLY